MKTRVGSPHQVSHLTGEKDEKAKRASARPPCRPGIEADNEFCWGVAGGIQERGEGFNSKTLDDRLDQYDKHRRPLVGLEDPTKPAPHPSQRSP